MQDNFFDKIKIWLSAKYITFGTKVVMFSRKHPYIFTQIVIYSLAILGAILASIFNYGGT